ncbi:MAG: vitamin K epoxide reductase family protein [Acidimicrobiales bacterium]
MSFTRGLGWRPATTLLLSLAGVGDAIYLTIAHYAAVPLACSDTGLINCEKVTTSPQSVVLGIPVAVLGLAWFLAMAVVNLPPMWNPDRALATRISQLRLVMSVAGMGFVLYLISVELFVVGAICLWCTAAHILAFTLFVVIVTGFVSPVATTVPAG